LDLGTNAADAVSMNNTYKRKCKMKMHKESSKQKSKNVTTRIYISLKKDTKLLHEQDTCLLYGYLRE